MERGENGEPIEAGFLSDLSWPADGRFQGRLLLAKRRRSANGRAKLSPGRIWWLMLSPDKRTIESAGRLTAPDPNLDDLDDAEEASPVLATTADDQLTLAYLCKQEDEKGWSLKIASLEFDKETLVPGIMEYSTTTLALHCYHSTPVFAVDGSWVACVSGRDQQHPKLERIPLSTASIPTPRGSQRFLESYARRSP